MTINSQKQKFRTGKSSSEAPYAVSRTRVVCGTHPGCKHTTRCPFEYSALCRARSQNRIFGALMFIFSLLISVGNVQWIDLPSLCKLWWSVFISDVLCDEWEVLWYGLFVVRRPRLASDAMFDARGCFGIYFSFHPMCVDFSYLRKNIRLRGVARTCCVTRWFFPRS